MVPDIVAALVITALAVTLGMAVNPVFFLVVVVAVVRLFFGPRTSGYQML